MDVIGIRIIVDLSYFMSGVRSKCYMFVNYAKDHHILDLEQRIRGNFSIKAPLSLVSNNNFLPPSEDIHVLRDGDIVRVVEGDFNTNAANQLSSPVCMGLLGVSGNCENYTRSDVYVQNDSHVSLPVMGSSQKHHKSPLRKKKSKKHEILEAKNTCENCSNVKEKDKIEKKKKKKKKKKKNDDEVAEDTEEDEPKAKRRRLDYSDCEEHTENLIMKGIEKGETVDDHMGKEKLNKLHKCKAEKRKKENEEESIAKFDDCDKNLPNIHPELKSKKSKKHSKEKGEQHMEFSICESECVDEKEIRRSNSQNNIKREKENDIKENANSFHDDVAKNELKAVESFQNNFIDDKSFQNSLQDAPGPSHDTSLGIGKKRKRIRIRRHRKRNHENPMDPVPSQQNPPEFTPVRTSLCLGQHIRFGSDTEKDNNPDPCHPSQESLPVPDPTQEENVTINNEPHTQLTSSSLTKWDVKPSLHTQVLQKDMGNPMTLEEIFNGNIKHHSSPLVFESKKKTEKSTQQDSPQCQVMDPTKSSPLKGEPRKDDIIAFKVLRLNHDYTPELSEFITVKVLGFSSESESVTFQVLYGHAQLEQPRGKFHLDDRNSDGVIDIMTMDMKSLIEPRLLFP